MLAATTLAALIALSATGPATAAESPGFSLLDARPQPREVVVKKAKDGRMVGRLDVLVRNDSPRRMPLVVRFLSTHSRRVLKLDATQTPGPQGLPAFYPTSRRRGVSLRRGAVKALNLRLAVRAGRPPSDIDGVLVLRRRGRRTGRIVTLRVKGVAPETAEAAGAPKGVFEPEKATLVVTRNVPFVDWFSGEEESVHLRTRDLGKLVPPTPGPLPQTRLGSGKGHELTAAVESVGSLVDDRATVEIEARDIGEAGEYSGPLSFDPLADDAAKLDVTVKVQHSFVWAFLTVLLSGWLGRILLQRIGLNQRKEKLTAALGDVEKRYREACSSTPPTQGRLYDLEKALGGGDVQRRIDDALAEVANANDPDSLTTAAAHADELVGRIGRWIAVHDALQALLSSYDPENVSRGAGIVRDTGELLGDAAFEPRDDKAAERLAASLEGQAAVVTVYDAARAADGIEIRDGEESDALVTPDTIYAEYPRARARGRRDTAFLVSDLHAYAVAAPRVTERPDRMFAVRADMLESVLDPRVVVETLVSLFRPRPYRPPSTQEVIAGLRRQTRTASLIVFLATAVTYVLTVWAGKDWGTPMDYITAVLAGIGGAAALNWDLFPGLRLLDKPE